MTRRSGRVAPDARVGAGLTRAIPQPSSATLGAVTGNLFDDLPGGSGWFTAYCDGGARGNPGPAAFGAVIQEPGGRTVARLSRFLGVRTNNYAEYQGLLAVLEWAIQNGASRLRVVSDSELMVRQMKGIYRVKNPGLRPLWEEAQRRARQLEAFEMAHTLRAGNQEADRLANEAMDKRQGTREQGEGTRERGEGTREQGDKGTREQGKGGV